MSEEMFREFSKEEKSKIQSVQTRIEEIRANQDLFIQQANSTAKKIDAVPNREKVIEENLLELSLMTISMVAATKDLPPGSVKHSLVTSKAIAIIFLLGVHYGMEMNADVPPAFKEGE